MVAGQAAQDGGCDIEREIADHFDGLAGKFGTSKRKKVAIDYHHTRIVAEARSAVA